MARWLSLDHRTRGVGEGRLEKIARRGIGGGRPRRSPREAHRPRAALPAGVARARRGAGGGRAGAREPVRVHARAVRLPCLAAARARRLRLRGEVSAVLDAPLPADPRVKSAETPPFDDPGAGLPARAAGLLRGAARRRARRPARPARGARAPREGALRRRVGARRGALAQFVRACGERELAFKATAGLHHAVATQRGARLPEPARGRRLRRRGDGARGSDPEAFVLDRDGFSWRDRQRRRRRGRARAAGAHSMRSAAAASSSRSRSSRRSGCSRCDRRRRVRRLLERRRRAAGRVPRRPGHPRPRCGRARRSLRVRDPEPVPRARARGLGGRRPARGASSCMAERSSSRSRTRSCTCRSRSPTTSTSTHRSSTRRTSAGCSGRTRIRCSRTGGTFPSATTAVAGRSS